MYNGPHETFVRVSCGKQGKAHTISMFEHLNEGNTAGASKNEHVILRAGTTPLLLFDSWFLINAFPNIASSAGRNV